MEVTLRAVARPTTGKGSARQTRIAGSVPAVLYGQGIEPVPLAVDGKQMGHALHTEAKANVLINLEVEGGTKYLTMVREIQRHPVRGYLIHVDFVSTARNVKTHASVPVSLVGESLGIRLGGVLEHHLWELQVEALPADIPDSIEVDIAGLAIGDHLRVDQVKPPRGTTIVNDGDEIVVSVIEPALVRGLPEDEPVAEDEAAAT